MTNSGVPGATVRVRRAASLDAERAARTDARGECLFRDLPAGAYDYRVTADAHDAVSGTVNVDPGVAATRDVFLPCRMVTVEWRVVPTTIEDRYEIVLNATYETDVPAAVVVCSPMSVTLPDMAAGDVFQGEFRLRNVGLIRAENVRAVVPAPDGFFRIELTAACPTELAAGEDVAIPFRVTCLAPLSGAAGAAGSVYGAQVEFPYESLCAAGLRQNGKARFYLLGSTDSRTTPVVWGAGPPVFTSTGGIGDTTVMALNRPVVSAVAGDRCTDDLTPGADIEDPIFAVGCEVTVSVSVNGCVGEGCPSSALVTLSCAESAVVTPPILSVPVGGTAQARLYGVRGSESLMVDNLVVAMAHRQVLVPYTVVGVERIEAEDEVGVGCSTQARAIARPAGWPVEWTLADKHGGTSQVLASIDASNGTVRVDEESGYGWVCARAEPLGVACAKLAGKQKKIEIGCVACPACEQSGGSGEARMSSLDVSIHLGRDSEGESAGRLYVYEESLNTNAWRPSGLRAALDSDEAAAVYDTTGRVRQVWAPAGVADVVCTNADGYAVRWYGLDQVSGVTSNGLRTFSGDPVTEWAFRRAGAGADGATRVDVVKTEGGLAITNRYETSEDGVGGSVWMLTQGNGLKRTRRESADLDSDTRIVVTEVSAGGGTGVASRAVEWKTEYAWGEEVVRREVDTGSDVEVSTWTFCSDLAATGMYGRVIAETTPGGGWATYGYDTSGRLARVVECWKDEAQEDGAERSKVTRYGYDPVDPRDDGSLWPDAAREARVEVCGVPIERSYAAYFYDDRLGRVEVSERCRRPDGAYGAEGNPRTTTTYHPEDGSAAAGRLERVEHADGRLETYTYASGTWAPGATAGEGRFEEAAGGAAWRRLRVRGTVARPEGIALRTTREVTVRDGNGRTVMDGAEVYTGSGYERIAWTERFYDGRGREVKTVRSNGEVSEQAWGCCGREREVDAAGGATLYALDALSRRTGMTRLGVDDAEFGAQPDRRIDYGLDAAGRQVSLTRSSAGDGATYRGATAYNLAGQVTNLVTEGGARTRVSRHSGGRVERTVTPDGLVRVSESYRSGAAKCVTENDVLAAWSDVGVGADGATWTMNWAGPLGTNSPAWQRSVEDALGRTVRTETPAFGGGVLTNRFVFDAAGRLVRATSPGLADRLFAYDELGEETASALDVNGNGRIDLAGPDRVQASRSGYEFGGRRGGGGGGEGWWRVRVDLVYPFEGSAAPVTNRVHRQRLTGFDAGCVAEDELVDGWGNVTVQRREVDRERRLARTVVDTPESATNAVQIELNGLLVRDLSATGVETRYTHDGFGRVVAATNAAAGRAQAAYGPDDRVLWAEDGGGGRTAFGYDPDTGRVTSITNANTNAAFYAHDAWGRRTAEWGAVYPVLRAYDAFGRLSAMGTVRDAAAVITNASDFTAGAVAVDFTGWLYDDATGLLTNKVYADGTRVRYGYTPARRLAWRQWARGVVTRYALDPASGQVTNTTFEGDSGLTPAVAMRHDRLGRAVRVNDGQGERAIVFGERGQLSEETLGGPDGFGLTYAYAATGLVGRLNGLATDAGWSVGYGYDGVGRLESVTARAATDAGERVRTARYGYEAGAGRMAGWGLDDGWSVARGFEGPRPRLAWVANTWQGVEVARHGYRTDAGGRRTRRVDGGSLWPPAGVTNDFGYNARDELLTARDGERERAFAFDPVGNRVSAVTDGAETLYRVNAVNACTQIVDGAGVTVPEWDADGNLLWDGRWRYKWDAENRLAGCDPADETNGARRLRFAYDYAGRRVRAEADERVAGGWEARRSTRYVWSGWQMLGEWTSGADVGGGAAWQFHAWGADVSGAPGGAGGVGGLLFTLASDGAVFDYGYDGNGNVSAVVESGSGDLTARAYTPFGAAASTVPGSLPRFGFSTKYTDPETGLLYYGYRYYDPQTARWLSRDPLGEPGGINLTTFCRNDPVSGIDPLGLAAYFFGGTGNNLTDDGWSNVEILFRAWDNDAGHGIGFYVPGVFSGYAPDGTPYTGLQSTKLAMLDEGIYGETVKERAEYMMGLLRTQLAAGDKEVNVFAFSRGSLTALVFLNMIADQLCKDPLFDGITINQTVLFDTVSHADKNLPSDLPESLTYTHQPIHLIAIDEQRKQFFDKDILDVQNALQVGFRGVHANVGGGHNNNSLSREPLEYVRSMMRDSGMDVFDMGVIWKYQERYGMIRSNAMSTPTKNDTWFYTMGHRDFPAGMFLSAGFMFRKGNLKNDVPDSLKDFNSGDQRLWSQGYRYIPGRGWIK